MHSRLSILLLVALAGFSRTALAADTASGSVAVPKNGTISPKFATAYEVRDLRNARTTQIEVMLTDVAIDPAPIRSALSPRMAAINAEPIKDRNYVTIWVSANGTVSMNATFSKTMTQYLTDSSEGLKAEWTTRTAARIEARVFSAAPLKTMDGTTYTVDLKFGVDLPKAEPGQALPAGGGDPGKAFLAFVAAVGKKDWNAIKASSSPNALEMFDRSYNTPAENAASANDLLNAWLSTNKMKVTTGQLRGNTAILDVEGDTFGSTGLSIVRMVKTGTVWQFDMAVRAGMVK